METAIISALKFNGYKIELSTNIKGKPVARLSKFITVGINKGSYKLIQGFYFATEQRREEWIKERMNNIKANVNYKQERISRKKDALSNMVNPFKVGDIFYESWGYDQTNIDFYMVVEAKEKSVIIEEIGAKNVEGSEGFMCCDVIPNPEHKTGNKFPKIIKAYIDCDNKPVFCLTGQHRGSLSLYTKGDKGLYSSWYA